MSVISRWASIASLICAVGSFSTAAVAQTRNQSLSWAPWGDQRFTTPSWSGFYIGGQVGGSFSTVHTNEFLAGTDERTNHFRDDGSSFSGGVNVGYDWQFGNRFVVGVLFDANGLNDKARHDFTGGNYIGSAVDFTASAQVRGGVLLTPNFLVYGQGGLAIADQRLQISLGGPETDESKTVTGFVIGGGGEWKFQANPLPFAKSTSVFVDYRHSFWDKATLSRPAASPFFDYAWCRDTDAINLGFRLRF
jgi:outer membrane immunogenic protein